MARHHHSIGKESIITGLIGAGVVAAWFLVLDVIRGRPFMTPSVLGQVIIMGRTDPEITRPMWTAVAAYTALHITAFLVLGLIVTRLVFFADRHNIARFALLMLFVAFEIFFYGMLVMVFQGTSGLFPFWSVLTANTLAAIGMAWYLLARHPGLRRGLEREPLGA